MPSLVDQQRDSLFLLRDMFCVAAMLMGAITFSQLGQSATTTAAPPLLGIVTLTSLCQRMTRSPLRFTQAEVTKLIKATRGTGFECVTIEVLPGTAGLRAIYTAGPTPKEEASELQARITKRNRRRRAEQASSSVGKLSAAPSEPEMVMTDEEWAMALRASELSNRERMALEALVQRRGRDVPIGEIKGAGVTTQKSLETRGYATIKMDGDRYKSWRVTDEGERFFRKIASLLPYF